jgi:SAM-dependent methyltransferase
MTDREHDMWDALNLDYELAYQDNPYKKALVRYAIQNLKPGSRVLDIGCGTGVPVAQMLDAAGMAVVGTDVAPQMVHHARKRCGGVFQVVDMVDYEPQGTFDAIFIIYSHLGLTYSDFHRVVSRVVQALKPGGLLAIGQSPADMVPMDDSSWDKTHTYVSGYNLPFWGKPFPTLMLTRAGQREFLESAGLEVIYDTLDIFQPDNSICAAEHQHYIIAKRRPGESVLSPQPLPERQDL